MRARTGRQEQQYELDEAVRPHEHEPSSGNHSRSRRFIHRLGQTIAVLGILVIGWSVYIYFYGDPITALYQDWRQHQLAHQLTNEIKTFKPPIPLSTPGDKAPTRAAIHAAAERFSHQVHPGDAIGRIEIPRIHISKVVVNGTDWASDLSRGPGRYPQSSWPGLGKVIAIAGHRTTFGAPFRHIDELASGNLIVLRCPTEPSPTESSRTRSSRATTGASSTSDVSRRWCSRLATRSTAPLTAGSCSLGWSLLPRLRA